MRPLPGLLLCATLAGLAGAPSAEAKGLCGLVRALTHADGTHFVARDVTDRVARNVTRKVAHRAGRVLLPAEAWAQDTMRFHALSSDDSLPDLEHVPGTPDAPQTPRIIISRSGEITRVGADIHVKKDEVVEGDVVAMGGDVLVEGHVQGSVMAMGGDVTLTSTARVDEDVACIGGELREETGAVVGGERVTALGGRGDRIVKRLRRGHDIDIDVEDRHDRGTGVVTSILWLLIALGVGWGLTRMAPGRTQAAVDTLKRAPALSLGIGALVWALLIPSIIALALVVALLCITIIGIPLAIAALLAYAAFLCVMWVWGWVVGVAALGERLIARRETPMAGVAPGVRSGDSLVRSVVWGVLALMGLAVFASLLRAVGMGPLHALGTFLKVIFIVGTSLIATFGGGAWLRSEFATGTLGRWWERRRNPFGGAPAAVPATATAGAGGFSNPGVTSTPAPPVAPPPPPAAPPSAYMPPSPPASEPPPTAEPPTTG